MSDPAIEAARRVWDKKEHRFGDPEQFIAVAREALEPIRELHVRSWDNCINRCCSGEQCRLRSSICEHCYDTWPCDTAKLVYSTEELES